MHKFELTTFVIIVLLSLLDFSKASRCFKCRSRGEAGSCRDPFPFNITDVENEPGLEAIPCASGWCGKVIEGGGTYSEDDFAQAVQRMCLQRGPDDGEGRCANTIYNYKKVFMCFCRGDLCNATSSLRAEWFLVLSFSIIYTLRFAFHRIMMQH